VQGIEVHAGGRWLYARGPILTAAGTLSAVIETGYDLGSVQGELRTLLLKTLIMVAALLLGSLWCLFLLLLIARGESPAPGIRAS
jgi:hypothetical protein